MKPERDGWWVGNGGEGMGVQEGPVRGRLGANKMTIRFSIREEVCREIDCTSI